MVRAVIYTRISDDKLGERAGVTRQREDCTAIVRARGWNLVDEYCDNSISASKRKVRRPEYDRMVADYEAGHIDAIVCWDLDRLTRQPRQLEDWIDRAQDYGLLLTTANGEADLATDSGRLFARIKAAVAREEIERKSERQCRAARQRAEQGRGSSFKPCYGYTSMNEIVPAEAEIVRALYQRLAAGDTVYGLTEWLREHGPAPHQTSRWSRTTVRGMLTNPRYAARVVYQGQVTATPGVWEPIIDDDLFDTVQGILSDPRRMKNGGQTARRHILSGIAHCHCGGLERGQGYAYVCADCGLSKAVAHADRYVIEVLEGRLASLPELPSPIRPDDEASAELMRLRDRLRTIEADYDNGFIDGRRYATATEKVAAQIETLEARQLRQGRRRVLDQMFAATDPVAVFRDASLDMRRAILDAFMTVTFMPRTEAAKRGRFDYDSIAIEWKAL